MGAGKVFCILGGIIALLSTFLFSFYSFEVMGFTYYGYGLGLFLNIGNIFASGEILFIIFTIVYIISVISGLLIIIGLKSRAFAIIGAIFALFLGVLLLLNPGFQISLGPDLNASLVLFMADPLVAGIIPFDLQLGFGAVSLGTILLLAGGVLGLIGGIMGPDDF